jgi:integrase
VIAGQRSGIASTYMAQTLDTHLGTIAISRLTPEKIGRFRDIRLKNISPASLKRELGILSGMINHAIREWGINIQQNPASMVSLPRMPQGRDRRLEPGEEEKLLTASSELRRIIIIALETEMYWSNRTGHFNERQ